MKASLAVHTPHPYRDTSRLQLDYDRQPTWLFYTREFVAADTVAVVKTYPGDLTAIKTLLLPVAGFHGPTTVVPARLGEGLDLAHSEILSSRVAVPPPLRSSRGIPTRC
jgi:hypothetical protein